MLGETTSTVATNKVDVLSAPQVAFLEYGRVDAKALRNATRLIMKEVDAGRLDCRRLVAHEIPAEPTPVLEWPNAPPPQFDVISYHACTRWDEVPLRNILCCAATERLRRLYGGRCGKIPHSTATHDLLVTQTFIRLYLSTDRRERRMAHDWAHAAELVASGWDRNRVPDALIRDRHGRREKDIYVEILGHYSARKLREQHNNWTRYWLV